MNTWTPEMAKTSIVLAVLLMAIAVYVFRKDKAMMLVVCFLIFNGLIFQPAQQMQAQECERAKTRQTTHTVNIWLGSMLVMTSETTATTNDGQSGEAPAPTAGNHP
ncbi:hypothetical protein [Cardiobacterium hominis]